jgi:hypothetical protein
MLCALLITVSFTALTFSAPLQVARDGASSLTAPLRFTSSGTFQISIFEDLRFGENAWDQWGPQQDINSVKVINEILDAESQQLVVLNGDLITGENTYLENSTHYVDEIVAPLVQRNLTWASTYGNHDSEFHLSREGILAREHLWRNSRTQQMVFGNESGVSNYYLPVFHSVGNEPCLLLWFFDSRGGFYFQALNASGDQVVQPDWVDVSVVDWFKETNQNLAQQYGRTIPSLAFVHIPTNASQALQTEAGVNPNFQPGINDDYILAQQAPGWCEDGSNDPTCVYGGQDVPFMQAITSTPGLIAVFSGHDHGDTWCYKWNNPLIPSVPVQGNGINLCFGQHSGYGGSGTWIRGSRQVFVTESALASNEVDTWIRLESGDVVGSVTLNSTYNTDYYSATPDTHTTCPACNYSVITSMPGTK